VRHLPGMPHVPAGGVHASVLTGSPPGTAHRRPPNTTGRSPGRRALPGPRAGGSRGAETAEPRRPLGRAHGNHRQTDSRTRKNEEGNPMARSDVLVSTDWAEKNIGTDGIVFVEVDEDTSAYDTGHIEG